MSFISKITSKCPQVASAKPKRLPNRFAGEGGFMEMGAVTRSPRQNTSKQILESLTAYADIYESRAQAAELKLIEVAEEFGVNLKKEAKSSGLSVFQQAKTKGVVEHEFEHVDFFTGEKYTKKEKINLSELAEDLENQKRICEANGREIRNFLAQSKGMSEEHLGIAHDIIDLSQISAFLNTNINLLELSKNGNTVMGNLLSKFPEVSRKNPGAIELLGKVFNHSDDTNSKYFIISLFGNELAKLGKLSEQINAIKDLVPSIAKKTLDGGYLMDYSRESKFFDCVAKLCRQDAKPENIRLIPKIEEIIAGNTKQTFQNLDNLEVALGDTKAIKENIDVLPQVLQNAENTGKSLDVSGFLTKNVNLV